MREFFYKLVGPFPIDMERQLKVRLKADLTKYHPNLVVGCKGVTVGSYGLWSRGSDRFAGVRFDTAGTFDILWESLEIIDQEYLEEQASYEKERFEILRTAKKVVRSVGPRGGFKYLSYEYTSVDGVVHHTSTGYRNEADRLIAFFKEQGIPVKEEILR